MYRLRTQLVNSVLSQRWPFHYWSAEQHSLVLPQFNVHHTVLQSANAVLATAVPLSPTRTSSSIYVIVRQSYYVLIIMYWDHHMRALMWPVDGQCLLTLQKDFGSQSNGCCVMLWSPRELCRRGHWVTMGNGDWDLASEHLKGYSRYGLSYPYSHLYLAVNK